MSRHKIVQKMSNRKYRREVALCRSLFNNASAIRVRKHGRQNRVAR